MNKNGRQYFRWRLLLLRDIFLCCTYFKWIQTAESFDYTAITVLFDLFPKNRKEALDPIRCI